MRAGTIIPSLLAVTQVLGALTTPLLRFVIRLVCAVVLLLESATSAPEALTTPLQWPVLRLVSSVFLLSQKCPLRLESAVSGLGDMLHLGDGRASRRIPDGNASHPKIIRHAVTLPPSFVRRLRIGQRLRIAE